MTLLGPSDAILKLDASFGNYNAGLGDIGPVGYDTGFVWHLLAASTTTKPNSK
jgi:hypothetical protein